MSETTNTKNVKDDEIDLSDLFKRMGRSIEKISRALGRAFLVASVFLLRRWLLLGLSVVLGIGTSYFFKSTSESIYTSDLVLRTNPVSTSDMISYINRLHNYCKENNIKALSNAISLKPEQIDNIIDIGAFWIIDRYKDGAPDFVDYKNNSDMSDTVNSRMQDRLDIRVKIKSPQNLTDVKNELINYINSDSLFQLRNRIRLRQNKEMLTRLDYDILLLDSLQKVKINEETKYRQSQNGGQMIFLQEQKTQLVYADIYKLYANKQALEADRDLYRDIVTILSDFTLTVKRVNGALFYGVIIVPAFFFLTLLLLVIIANRKKLEEVYKKY